MHYRTALITGASSGIGLSLARLLAAQGTQVVLAARREPELRALAADIAQAGGQARVCVLDVADTEGTVQTLRALDAELGGLDLIVANAGVGAPPAAPDSPPYAWESLRGACHINFTGAAATLTAVLPAMVERGRGHLVGISSLASFGALPGSAAYCAPKAGLSMLLSCLRLDLLRTGVRVTSVHVGFVRTAMVARSTHPMPFLMESDEAARYILDRLPAAPACIDFPWPMVLLTRALARLPRPIRDWVMRVQKFS